MDKKEIIINSLSFKQAAKWILIHEYRRHLIDCEGIKIDLANLKDIEVPQEAMELIDYHFVIPPMVQICKDKIPLASTFVPKKAAWKKD